MMSFCVVPDRLDGVVALLLGGDLVHRQQPHRRGVDRHRRVHLVERDVLEQPPHRPEMGNRHPDLADLALGQLVVGVVAGLGGQVERHGQPGLPLLEVAPVQGVRLRRGAVSGVRPHHPGLVRHDVQITAGYTPKLSEHGEPHADIHADGRRRHDQSRRHEHDDEARPPARRVRRRRRGEQPHRRGARARHAARRRRGRAHARAERPVRRGGRPVLPDRGRPEAPAAARRARLHRAARGLVR